MLWAFYEFFPSFSFTIMLFLHTSLSFAFDRKSGGSESPSFIWERFPVSEKTGGVLFPSFNAMKDELPASGGAELVLGAAVAHGVAWPSWGAQITDQWKGSEATSCAASLMGLQGTSPLVSVQVLADVGTRIALLIRQLQYLSEKNFHGKSWAINLTTNHNISLLLGFTALLKHWHLSFHQPSPLTSSIMHLQGEGSGLTNIFILWSLWFINHVVLPSELKMPFQIISCAKVELLGKRDPW